MTRLFLNCNHTEVILHSVGLKRTAMAAVCDAQLHDCQDEFNGGESTYHSQIENQHDDEILSSEYDVHESSATDTDNVPASNSNIMLSSKYTELLEKYRTEKSARLELEEANQTLEEEIRHLKEVRALLYKENAEQKDKIMRQERVLRHTNQTLQQLELQLSGLKQIIELDKLELEKCQQEKKNLQEELELVKSELQAQINCRLELERVRDDLFAEVEELTASLFAEANKMVATEAREKHKLLQEKENLQKQLESVQNQSHSSGTDTPPFQSIHQRLKRMSDVSGWVNTIQFVSAMSPKTRKQLGNRFPASSGSSDSPREHGFVRSKSTLSPAELELRRMQLFSTLQPSVVRLLQQSPALAPVCKPPEDQTLQLEIPLLEPEPSMFEMFRMFVEDEREDLQGSKYVQYLYTADVVSCLTFPGRNKPAKDVWKAVLNCTLEVEVVAPNEVRAVECHYCGETRACKWRCRTSQGNNWVPIEEFCRGRIVATYNLIAFLRNIRDGLTKDKQITDLYKELIKLRLLLAAARIFAS